MKFVKNLIAYFFIVIAFFLIIELFLTKFFQELSINQKYVGHKKIDEETSYLVTKNKKQFYKNYKNLNIRKSLDDNHTIENNTIWIIGDSVTAGYGLKYTDTYYYLLDKKLRILNNNYKIIPIAGYGNNLDNVIQIVNDKIELFNSGDFFVFQFNFNDILPETLKEDDQNSKLNIKNSLFVQFKKRINSFRYQYLTNLTFYNVLTHYASIMKKKIRGNCEARGLDALGQYTYSYGSIKYLNESIKAWDFFEKKISNLNLELKKKNIRFVILISPISLQLAHHEKQNYLNYDLNCSNIDGKKKLLQILTENNIIYSDPIKLFKEVINKNNLEGNYESLFFDYDTNHPNEKGNLLLALTLFQTIIELTK